MKKLILLTISLMLNLTQFSYATTSETSSTASQSTSPEKRSQAPQEGVVLADEPSTSTSSVAASSTQSTTNLTPSSSSMIHSEKQINNPDIKQPNKTPTSIIQPISNDQLADVDSSNPKTKIQSLNQSSTEVKQPSIQAAKPLSSPNHSLINTQTANTPQDTAPASTPILASPIAKHVETQTPTFSSSATAPTSISKMTTNEVPRPTPFSLISPQAASQLSNHVLSINEISEGADETQNSYVFCLTQTHEQMQINPDQFSTDALISKVADNCAPTEDLFGIYNVLLAASQANKFLSETQAARYLDRSYQNFGREQSNRVIRVKILKLLGFIQ